MEKQSGFFISLLTNGKYQSLKDETNLDAILRLIVLNITYFVAAIIIIGLGITDMQNGRINLGIVQLLLAFMILLNLLVLRTDIPFTIGAWIVTVIFGAFCAISLFAKHDLRGLDALWIYSFPLISIYTLGLRVGLVPALLLFAVIAFGTFTNDFTKFTYSLPEAILVCGVYLLVLGLTTIYDYVRTFKDRWLEKQDHYLQMVFDNSPDIIMLLDKNVKLIYCAKTLLEKAGIPSFGEIRKTNYWDVMSRFMSIEMLSELVTIFRTSNVEMKPIIFERTIDFSKEGNNPSHYEIHFTPMYDNKNVFQGSLIMFHDMTKIMLTQEKLEQASRAKSSFLANMSHEIRTPLNAITGMTTIARDSTEILRKDYCLDRIRGASIHLLGIINDILDMSKIEENKFELSETEFEFFSMIDRVVSLFEFRLGEKRLNLVVNKDTSIPRRIISDEQRLAQVVTNLLSNAIKFTPEGGDITMTIRRLEDKKENHCTLEISVKDTGIGISKEHQKKLFSSFVQVDSSIARRFGGTGLGLAISKKIVELMDGDIHIESEENKGAAFIFNITAEIPESGAADSAYEEPGEKDDSPPDFSGKWILLAEDVEINREIVMTVLEPLGISIIEAEDGQRAYDLFCASPESIDLIFMDIHMPGIDGYDAARLIRAYDHPRAKTVPIIAMTANVFKEDVEHCLTAGMDGHIGKPLDFNVMIAILKKYLT